MESWDAEIEKTAKILAENEDWEGAGVLCDLCREAGYEELGSRLCRYARYWIWKVVDRGVAEAQRSAERACNHDGVRDLIWEGME